MVLVVGRVVGLGVSRWGRERLSLMKDVVNCGYGNKNKNHGFEE